MRSLVQGLSRCRHMLRDTRGAVAVLFGLAIVPLVFIVGAALDYSGASNLKTHLQKATDGTNLALCQMPVGSTQAALTQQATRLMSSYVGSTPYNIQNITTTTSPWTVAMTTQATFQTAVMKGLSSSFAAIPVQAYAKCYGQPQTFEIALVLDNTGSMATSYGGTSKIEALRQAATSFVNYVFTDIRMGPNSRVSLVPFASSVAVNPTTYRNAGWIDQLGLSPYHWSILQGGAASAVTAGLVNRFSLFNQLKAAKSTWDWTGCLESLPFPLNTQDTAPSTLNPSSLLLPLFAPDESGSGGESPGSGHRDGANNYMVSVNSYIDDWDGSLLCPSTTDEYVRNGRACKYAAHRNAQTSNGYMNTGPNASCTTRPLTRLGRSATVLTNEIGQMQPLGSTNIHEGFMWGWRTISPVSVFSTGTADETPASYTTAFNNKIIVLMTDGANTWNASPFSDTQAHDYSVLKSYHSAYGYLKNPDGTNANARVPAANANSTTGQSNRAAIDALTLQACANARAAPNNIVIYTVGFSTPNDPIDSQGLNLLRTCAGNPTRAFVANDSSTLQSVFQQIAQNIGALRFTN